MFQPDGLLENQARHLLTDFKLPTIVHKKANKIESGTQVQLGTSANRRGVPGTSRFVFVQPIL